MHISNFHEYCLFHSILVRQIITIWLFVRKDNYSHGAGHAGMRLMFKFRSPTLWPNSYLHTQTSEIKVTTK